MLAALNTLGRRGVAALAPLGTAAQRRGFAAQVLSVEGDTITVEVRAERGSRAGDSVAAATAAACRQLWHLPQPEDRLNSMPARRWLVVPAMHATFGMTCLKGGAAPGLLGSQTRSVWWHPSRPARCGTPLSSRFTPLLAPGTPLPQVNPYKTHRIDPPSTTVTATKDELLQYFKGELSPLLPQFPRARLSGALGSCGCSVAGATHQRLCLAGM